MASDSVREMMQQAVAHHGRGDLEIASRLYNDVLQREPRNSDALHLLGVVAHQQGRDEEAVELIGRAIDGHPRAPAFRNNLGLALTALGRNTEAERAYQEALVLAPDFADAVLNLGNLRAGQGRTEEAVVLLEKAVALDPDAPEAHYNLGWARFAVGNPEGALTALRRAIALGADFAEAYYRTGSVCLSLGRLAESTDCFRQALSLDADHLGAQHGLLACLEKFPASIEVEPLERVITPLLKAPSVNPRSIGHAAAHLLERKYRLDIGNESNVARERLCDRLLDDAIVRLYLQRTINVSAALERLLSWRRARWLERVRERGVIARPHWSAVGAVAIQCFLNEFAWPLSSDEEHATESLGRHIAETITTVDSADETLMSALLIYACYRPLWRSEFANQLDVAPADAWPTMLQDFIRISVHEPIRERRLRQRISSGPEIRDRVSSAVQTQYEANPYPRWLAITRRDVESIEQRVQRWCPGYVARSALRGPLRVLVAGCGTGMDAIEAALHLEDAHITAVDLSRASLAYALRKAEEYGLKNIRFQQQDILDLARGGSPFHVIHCTGVLHHMESPTVGLQRLVELLSPGGIMKLALYSRIARKGLLAAREVIHSSGFAPREDDIRAFRRQVLNDGDASPLAEIMGSTDFFSLSECRDLLFHVHEVQFTLPEVGSVLADAGLEFLGFELPIAEVEAGFRRQYPGEALTNLEAWNAYELEHPESFRAMYQFWCRKKEA